MKTFKPMLAYGLEESDLPNLRYPLIIQPKLDGIRCLIIESKAVSRKLKRIPNRYIRKQIEFKSIWSTIVDGELIINGKTFNEIQSAIMSEEGEPDFTYVIFDTLREAYFNEVYDDRRLLNAYIKDCQFRIECLNSHIVHNVEELLQWEQYILKDGHEGIILRDPNAPYKFGRSTLKEQALMKFKRFKDSEAEIICSNPFLSNCNALESDELGYAKHSSHKENLVPENKLGSWTVRDTNPESPFFGKDFNVGTGFTELQRVRNWEIRDKLVGRIIKYKYQSFGVKNLPRSPVYLGFRND